MTDPTPPIKLASTDDEWLAAICRGTPPFERLRHPAFRVGRHPGEPDEARQWIAAAAHGFGRSATQALDVMGFDESSVTQAFAAATPVTAERLPAWGECLIGVIRALPEHSQPTGHAEDSVEVATRALLGPVAELVASSGVGGCSAKFDSQMLVALASQLATRMLLTCGATLELENTTRADPVWDFGRDAWLERLCGFPGLNFVIGTAIRQWRQNALELLTRIDRDLPLIEQALFGGAKAGPVIAIDPDLGDRHNDGRSVAILTFASGRRVVYKPKNARCALCFMDLVGLLNRASASLKLPTQRILACGDYSWEEFVEQREATTRPEAARFFRRFGMVLRLLQLLEARDFWIDNLCIAGDVPVFVDLECIMQPRIDGEGFQVGMPDLDPELYEESVLPTGAVTQPIEVPGAGRQDFGALSSLGLRALPLGMWSGYRDRRNGNIWLRGGRLFWAPDAAWPRLNGRPAAPEDHLADLETGYREMQALLLRCAPEIRSAKGLLGNIGDAPVRVLMRSTWEYLVLLRASLEPSALLSGNARELALASVPATVHKWGDSRNINRRAAIARRELDALRVLDIPVFYSLPCDEALVAPGGATIPDVFSGVAIDRVRNRLESVESFNVDIHLEILKFAIRSMAASTEPVQDIEVADGAR